jgi:hypothetical protein
VLLNFSFAVSVSVISTTPVRNWRWMAFNDAWTAQKQNTSGLSLQDEYGSRSTDPSTFSIEHMNLPELMLKNRAVRELHQNWTSATTAAIETTQVNNALLKEMAELKAEVQRLKVNEGPLLPCVSVVFLFFILFMECLRYALNRMRSRNNSISPSDSASHYANTPPDSDVQSTHNPGRSAVRPNHFPETILWNFSDLKSDPDVTLDPSNANRPPMQSVIRRENGELIDTGLYMAIRASGHDIIKDELFSPLSRDKSSQNRPRTMKFFKDTCRDAWNKAIRLYEEEQPLLMLCSGHWKAEHMLQSILTNIQAKDTRTKNKSKHATSQTKGKAKARGGEHGHEKSPLTSYTSGKRARTGSSATDQSTSSPRKKPKGNDSSATNTTGSSTSATMSTRSSNFLFILHYRILKYTIGPQDAVDSTPSAAAESLLHLRRVGNGSSAGDGEASASMEFDTDLIVVSASCASFIIIIGTSCSCQSIA